MYIFRGCRLFARKNCVRRESFGMMKYTKLVGTAIAIQVNTVLTF